MHALRAQVRGKFAHGVTLVACTNVTVANLTMHNVGMFFIIDWAGHGNQVSHQPAALPYPTYGCYRKPSLSRGLTRMLPS